MFTPALQLGKWSLEGQGASRVPRRVRGSGRGEPGLCDSSVLCLYLLLSTAPREELAHVRYILERGTDSGGVSRVYGSGCVSVWEASCVCVRGSGCLFSFALEMNLTPSLGFGSDTLRAATSEASAGDNGVSVGRERRRLGQCDGRATARRKAPQTDT